MRMPKFKKGQIVRSTTGYRCEVKKSYLVPEDGENSVAYYVKWIMGRKGGSMVYESDLTGVAQ